MHELAICQALMEQVESIAAEEHAEQVVSIHLGIGPLSGVEPGLLEQAFYVARAGSVAEQAELVIESVAVQVSCKQCGRTTEALPNRLLCGHCGDWHTSLVHGDELQLQHLELIRPTMEEAAAPAVASQTRQEQLN